MNKVDASGNGRFGVNVWWTCPEVIRDASTVQNALTKHGFEKNDIPLPSRRTEISRACYSFQNRQGKSNRHLTEKANDNVNFVTYGILDRQQEESDKVGFNQNTTIRLDKSTDEVKVEGSLASEVMESIKTYSGKVTDDDIRYFLRRVIRMCFGIAKRPTGGIYFVPDQFSHVIKSAQSVLDEMNTGAKMYVEGVVNGVQERQNVWSSVEEEIEGRLAETLSAVERIERRTSAVKDHEEKLKGVKDLMDTYVGLLGEEAKYQGIAEKIEVAVKTVGEKLTQVQKGTASVISTVKPSKVAPAMKKAANPPPPKAAATGTKEFSNEFLKAAFDVLKTAGKPMSHKEITAAAVANGFNAAIDYEIGTAIYNSLSYSVRNNQGVFKKVGAGVFDLVA